MTMTFRKGDRVHVEFDATVGDTDIASFPAGFADGAYRPETYRSAFTTFVTDDNGFRHFVYLSDLTAESSEPENWPPKIGEIWQTSDGARYFVREDLVIVSQDRFPPAGHLVMYYGDSLDRLRALSPSRVFPEA
jgi:hypothetical protein